jgi:hypothetical protein
VRKYLFDLRVERGSNQLLFPVTVIGKRKAGKTSLVQSVQQNKRVLTQRESSEEGLVDAATKVFKVCEADVDKTTKLIFTDFGGHTMYHFSYQLTFKTQCVPLLVIDIAEFDRLADKNGEESACEELCLTWLAHLYISSPRLNRPVVVLTHRDKLSDERFIPRKQQLIEVTERLRQRIIEAERSESPTLSPVFTMTTFSDTSEPFIGHIDILDLSDTSDLSDISDLKDALLIAGSELITEIPGIWYLMLIRITERVDQPFIHLSEIDKEFPDDKEHVTLQYLHKTGCIMWFGKIDKLSNYIFHRSEVLTGLIEILYSHTLDDTWSKRLNLFSPFTSDGKKIDKRKYTAMIDNFNATGVIEASLLLNLLEKESTIPADISVEILKTFHLIHLCGPTSDLSHEKYIVPYFAKEEIKAPEVFDSLIPLKVDLWLRGLPIPGYVFSLITAAYLDINSDPYNYPEVGKNGVTVTNHTNKSVKYLLHDATEKRLSLITLAPLRRIGDAWCDHLASLRQLISELRSVWKAVRYQNVFVCSHCLLSNKPTPTTAVDPDWFQPENLDGDLDVCYTGKETCVCKATAAITESETVPTPLISPCE